MNANKIIGILLANVKCMFSIIMVAIMNYDNIIPSIYNNEDIQWDQLISSPLKYTANVKIILEAKNI